MARVGRSTIAALALVATAAAAPILLPLLIGSAGATPDLCSTPLEIVELAAPLPRTVAKLAAGGPFTIVTLGSSSTAGTGASRPDRNYPSRLAALLRASYPKATIRVVNRGIGGETATAMERRIARDVLPEKPDLVIWQAGTNAVLHDEAPEIQAAALHAGIATLQQAGSDVLLMDLQYAPAVLSHPGYRDMLHVIAAVAHEDDVPLFHRFAVMRHWADEGTMSLSTMLSRDHLHMSDQSYDCLAREVGASIRQSVREAAEATSG